jgi:hypothetical protein
VSAGEGKNIQTRITLTTCFPPPHVSADAKILPLSGGDEWTIRFHVEQLVLINLGVR